jgi:CubicO group peptidase (beta-lactamase class C family)
VTSYTVVAITSVLGLAMPVAHADRFEGIRDHIRERLVADSIPSLSVAVVEDGRILWEEGFGWADRERRIAATEHTAYSLASVTKPITATGLMTLVESGAIDLDAPVNAYLGGAKLHARVGDVNAATVRSVANHTSGLPVHYQFFYADEPYRPPSRDETILRYGNLVAAPGERHEYSNLGYGVLDYVIQRVSGQSYARFMRRAVFLPLGMTRTSVGIGPGMERDTAARYGADGLPLPFYDFDHPGASAVFASAHDLARFAAFHLGERLRDQKPILSRQTLDEMHRRTTGDEGYGYGVGFELATRNGRPMAFHSGDMGGVATQLRLYLRERLAIIALSNFDSGLPQAVVERIAGEMLSERDIARPRERPLAAAFVTPPELLGSWKGMLATYQGDLPFELHFLPDGDVHARLGAQPMALVNGARFRSGRFTGELSARIGTEDTERYRYVPRLSLKLRGDVLDGACTATGVPGPRMRNALSHWVRLRRAVGAG